MVAGLSAADDHGAVLGRKFDRRPRRARSGAARGLVLLALDLCAVAASAPRLAASEARLARVAGELADRGAAWRAGDRVVQPATLHRPPEHNCAQFDADPVGAPGARSCSGRVGYGRPDKPASGRGGADLAHRGARDHRARRPCHAVGFTAQYRRRDHRRRGAAVGSLFGPASPPSCRSSAQLSRGLDCRRDRGDRARLCA